ncbi:MAG: hypothetical protein AABX71_00235 [Nanoarchaeota archaeon]
MAGRTLGLANQCLKLADEERRRGEYDASNMRAVGHLDCSIVMLKLGQQFLDMAEHPEGYIALEARLKYLNLKYAIACAKKGDVKGMEKCLAEAQHYACSTLFTQSHIPIPKSVEDRVRSYLPK